jgi:hypothetical protein
MAAAMNVPDDNVRLWFNHLFLKGRPPTRAQIDACYVAADRFAAEFFEKMAPAPRGRGNSTGNN